VLAHARGERRALQEFAGEGDGLLDQVPGENTEVTLRAS
jgi:hypothetical protein